jgi:phospholipid transport system substrate-binding protein
MSRWAMVGLALALVLVVAQPVQAGAATDVVRDTVNKVLATANDNSLTEEQRLARIQQVVLSRFGFEEMARRCLGHYWNERTPAERAEFIKLFTSLLGRAYIHVLEALGAHHTIQYGAERIDGDQVEVCSTVVVENRDRVPVRYRLRQTDNGWQFCDLVIDDVSIVSNYRTQFGRIIQEHLYPALIKRIRAKVRSEEAIQHGPQRSADTSH